MTDPTSSSITPSQVPGENVAHFVNYFQRLSKGDSISVRLDSKVQQAVKNTFSALAELSKQNPNTANTKVTIEGWTINVGDLKFKEIEAFVKFANTFFEGIEGKTGYHKEFAANIDMAADYIKAKVDTTLSQKLAGKKGDLLEQISILHHKAVLTDTKITEEIKFKAPDEKAKVKEAFLHAKEAELNVRIEHEQTVSRDAKLFTKLNFWQRASTPLKIASAVSVAIFAGLAALTGVGAAVALICVIGGGLYALSNANKETVLESINASSSAISAFEQKKKKLPEFYDFLKENNIDTDKVVHKFTDKNELFNPAIGSFREMSRHGENVKRGENGLYEYEIKEGVDKLFNFFENKTHLKKEIEERENKLKVINAKAGGTLTPEETQQKDSLPREIEAYKNALANVDKELQEYLKGSEGKKFVNPVQASIQPSDAGPDSIEMQKI